jgi:hypothetical protein
LDVAEGGLARAARSKREAGSQFGGNYHGGAPGGRQLAAPGETCAEDHDDDDFRRVVRSSTVILGPRACMGVILVKSGERQVRLPIWVCQAAPGETGTYLNTALPPRADVDAVRCTVVKATLLRPQPCVMLPRARQVALARSNLVFAMRRRSHKANWPGVPGGQKKSLQTN